MYSQWQQNIQSGYSATPYQYSHPPSSYYPPPPHQHQQNWQPVQSASSQQPWHQNWTQTSNEEPPPPGTVGDGSGCEDNKSLPPPPPPPPPSHSFPSSHGSANWAGTNYWPSWSSQGWTGVDQWRGQWPHQHTYWNNTNVDGQNYGYSNSGAAMTATSNQTPPPNQLKEATPPSSLAPAGGRLQQPRIQQYSQAGYTTELAPSQQTDGTQPVSQETKTQSLLPLPPQQSGGKIFSEKKEDQPPARKRASRWDPPPPLPTATPTPPTPPPPLSESEEESSSNKLNAPLTPDQWPPKLREYIDRAFAACEGREADLETVQQFLKVELNDIFRQNRAWDIDWDSKPLPLDGRPPPRSSRWDTPSPSRSDFQNNMPATPTVGPGARGRKKKGGFKRKRGGKMFFIDTGASGENTMSLAEQQRLDQRAHRFADGIRSSYKKKLSVAELVAAATAGGGREEGDLNWEEFAIEGTSQALEKPYLRLTSAPDPSVVRPLSVLRQSMVHVLSRWDEKGDYRYTCEQFKSIRQDLTIQGIRNEFAVEVYESHARIALDNGDRGEFNQCQAQLKALYLEGVSGNEAEFIAYRILYLILTLNSADMSTELRDLSVDLKSHPSVDHALQLWTAWQLGNYCQFFRLFRTAPGSGRSLLKLFVLRERLSALKTILKAFRPTVPLSYISQSLGLSQEECRQWLTELELPVSSSALLDCKACSSLLQAKSD